MEISSLENFSSDDSDFERSLPLGSSSQTNGRISQVSNLTSRNHIQVSVKRPALNQVSLNLFLKNKLHSKVP